MGVLIKGIEPDSPAARAGIRAGETLVSVNGRPVRDVLDYRFFTTESKIELELSENGQTRRVSLRKSTYADLGLLFETYLMDRHKGCKNACVFCFIDQLPPGLRKSLYFKDDDERLSFLFGNYITLTNLTDQEADRICEMHLSPVNISVHTTDPQLRVKMMRNPKSGEALRFIDQFDRAGIQMNFQIVLCPGLNDGEALNKTLSDLTAKENVNSVAVVPVGLTAHREKLYPLQPFTRETALAAVKQIEAFGDRMVAEKGMRLVMAADELYLKAGLPLPPYDDYEDFPQLENGVGMLTLFDHEFTRALEDLTPGLLPRYLIATGEAAYPFLKEWVDRFNQRFHTSHEVRSVKNLLFGGEVTVAGLLSGGDLAAALGDCSGQGFSALLLANSMLRSGEPVFLDDSTPDDLAEKIGLGVRFIDPDGTSFAQALAGQL